MLRQLQLLLVGATTLVPTAYSSPTVGTIKESFHANFDDLPPELLVVGGSSPVPVPYRGLRYAFNINSDSVNDGIIAKSLPSKASSGVRVQLNQGPPIISRDYPGSNVKSFDVNSFALGCSQDVAPVTGGGAVKCAVEISGIRAGTGEPVGPQIVLYKPDPLVDLLPVNVRAPMQTQTLTVFKNMEQVRFKVVDAVVPVGLEMGTTVIYIDDVKGNLYRA